MSSANPGQRWVVVDDTDVGSITYTPSSAWFQDSGNKNRVGNYGAPYLGTLHGSSNDGDVIFNFNGTAVHVIGSNLGTAKTKLDPNLECFIDDVSIGRENPFEFDENNWGFCKASNLSPGPHTLRVDVKVANPKNQFWLDRIMYVPTPDVNLEEKVIMIDHTDPTVRFDASWSALSDVARMTTTKGSVAQIDFIGESITWMSFIPTERSHAGSTGSWYLDSDSDKPTQFLLTGLPSRSATLYNQVFFTTPNITQGRHTLTVIFSGNETTTPLTLDYLYIKNGPFPRPGSDGAGTNGNQSHDNIGGQSANNTGISRHSLGVILGAVIGGVLLVVVILSAFVIIQRRRRASRGNRRPVPFNVNDIGGLPSTADSTYQAQGKKLSKSQVTHNHLPQTSTNSIVNVHSTTPVVHLNIDTTLHSTDRRSSTSRSFHHVDSGLRLGDHVEVVREVPPNYTPE